MKPFKSSKTRESGSALIISILVLFILSVLGMAVMLTTTTETQISVNYRWGEMAFFNADAALEYGKNVLATHALKHGDFEAVLPQVRTDITVNHNAAWGEKLPAAPLENPACMNPLGGSAEPCRDFQYYIDQGPDDTGKYRRIYIGLVLRDSDHRAIQFDFRQHAAGDTRGDIDGDNVGDIQGTVTLWVRRPVQGNEDYPGHDRVVLTAEGTAPNYESTETSSSMRRLEMTVALDTTGISGDRHSDVTKNTDESTATGGWNLVATAH